MRQLPKLFTAFLLFFSLTACQALQLTEPETFSQKWSYALTANASIRTAAATAVDSEILSMEKGEYALRSTDAIRSLLDESLELSKTDISTAEGKLSAAQDLIEAIKSYLTENGAEL